MWNSIIAFFRRLFGASQDDAMGSAQEDPDTRGLPDPQDFAEDGIDVFDDSIGELVSATEGPDESTERSLIAKPTLEIEDLGPVDTTGEDARIETGTVIEIETTITTVVITQPRYLWCLDNGHGELQEGKRSPFLPDGRQLEEWEFNRDIVRRIILQLEKAGVQYFNVVPETQVGSFLKGRVARANEKESDLGLPKIFVSIHANAAPLPSPNTFRNGIDGIETYCYPNSRTGKKLARVFQGHLVEDTGWRDRGVKENPFYVLANTQMPAILTENGFYTDETQTKQLLSEEWRQKIADAHVKAILEMEKVGIEGLPA